MTFESMFLQLCICMTLEQFMIHFCYHHTKFNYHDTFAEHMIAALCDWKAIIKYISKYILLE